MKIAYLAALVTFTSFSATAFAQYDYNDDLTRAVPAHYPPLIRLLITKGARQNTQDAHGDTPLMQAIRSGDTEVTKLLLGYQPNSYLLNTSNHSAATEAVLADDPESLRSVLMRDDTLQVAQSLGLATKLNKRRALNMFVQMYGAAATDEIGQGFLSNPLKYFRPGSQVALAFSPSDARPEVCGTQTSKLLLQGKICKIDGDRLSIEWQTVSNLDNTNTQCSSQKHFRLERKTDQAWDARYLGMCGAPPDYFPSVPASFDFRTFLIPEFQ
ncbi:ankyrin repeat domain-containing protein [Trinickia violacea]|uniref:Ankyrin repeat domain-containing protein n=1 Tax=Trinickia violacea TaxID=2571746 RepID=A0A4P8IVZ9_9BURK|nr:ankyrin repeat domain-containing protein [Trinickia violacea]QCP53498.1 ankyrin repeat domain-containing protein [Trinickia violacea]